MNNNKKRIAVIFGGCSSEYGVSLQSAHSVITNLDYKKYDIYTIGISNQGVWYLYQGNPSKILDNTWMEDESTLEAIISPSRNQKGITVFAKERTYLIPIDMAFPVLHGKNGEDGTIQGLLELAGIPIVGCDMTSSAICMDKNIAHKLAEDAGIRVPKSFAATKFDDKEAFMKEIEALGFPMYVKPVKAGSSFGITKVHNREELPQAIAEAFKFDDEVICEENIEGFEVGCAIFGNDNLSISPVDEIELFVDWFDYDEKYTQTKSKIHLPARIDDEISEKVREMSGQIYKALGCRGFARVDLFLTPNKEIVFNEVNTIPGFTTHSRYPNMVKGMGVDYPELLDKLIELAEEN
ncbi:MAG: D-alanine--D-serine ligase VanG [Eubacteriales bacterium]|nr:D-alanine--D-serine ligase VanG [Eubacteriales bacterium]